MTGFGVRDSAFGVGRRLPYSMSPVPAFPPSPPLPLYLLRPFDLSRRHS